MDNNANDDVVPLRQDRMDALPRANAYSCKKIITRLILMVCPSGTMDNNDNDHVVPLRQDREDALPRVAGLFCEISAARVFAW